MPITHLLANPGPPVDIAGALDAFSGAYDKSREANVLRQIGQAARGGDYGAAADVALGAGKLDAGVTLQKLAADKKAQIADIVAAGAMRINSPQEWQQYVEGSLVPRFGEGMREYADFGSRQALIDEALGVKGMLEQQRWEASHALDREQVGLARERLGLEREKLAQGDPTTDMRNYRFAVEGGYEGTPMDFFSDMAQAKSTKVNIGREAVDKEYAKEFTEWKLGGSADAVKQIAQLQEVADVLEKGEENVTGPIKGRLPDFAAPRATDLRETVEEVVQRNLRSVLGAQFTEKEGERLIKRAYNPNLDEKQNAARLRRLIKQMELAAEAKADAARYFEQNGTLTGWQGRLPTIEDFQFDDDAAPDGGMSAEDRALIEKYSQ